MFSEWFIKKNKGQFSFQYDFPIWKYEEYVVVISERDLSDKIFVVAGLLYLMTLNNNWSKIILLIRYLTGNTFLVFMVFSVSVENTWKEHHYILLLLYDDILPNQSWQTRRVQLRLTQRLCTMIYIINHNICSFWRFHIKCFITFTNYLYIRYKTFV